MADLMSAVGGFAMLCRCGIEKCVTHVTSDMGDRVVLPPSVEPKHYDVSLSLRLEEHAFDGVCEIVVDVKEPVSSITVHAKELTFASASVDGSAAVKVTVDEEATTGLRVGEPDDEGRLAVHFSRRLAGEYEAVVHMNGAQITPPLLVEVRAAPACGPSCHELQKIAEEEAQAEEEAKRREAEEAAKAALEASQRPKHPDGGLFDAANEMEAQRILEDQGHVCMQLMDAKGY